METCSPECEAMVEMLWQYRPYVLTVIFSFIAITPILMARHEIRERERIDAAYQKKIAYIFNDLKANLASNIIKDLKPEKSQNCGDLYEGECYPVEDCKQLKRTIHKKV